MEKYKCLSEHYDSGRMFNKIFNGDHIWGCGLWTAKQLAIHPDHKHQWEIIKEENNMSKERQITLTLDEAKKMYCKSPEMDELLLANFSKEELTKKELPKSWSDLARIEGYFIDSSSAIIEITKGSMAAKSISPNKNGFATKKQAESALAMAQLSQLMSVYNDGWQPEWGDSIDWKYTIFRERNHIRIDYTTFNYQFLAFKYSEIRDQFLSNFEPLIKQYFMIN